MPRALLYSTDHSGLAVAAWCLYESLESPSLIGDRVPARAGRSWVAERLGTTEPTLDRARTQLLAEASGGPWLAREQRGRKQSTLHCALGRPRQTRAPYAAVPAWTLEHVHAGTGRPEGTVSPDAWRVYVVLVDRLDPQGHDLTVARLGEWLGCSADTARRRLHELEVTGWVVVRRSSGLWLHVRVVYREDLVGVVEQEEDTETTPRKSEESPLADLTSHPLADLRTPYETPSENTPLEDTTDFPLAVGDLRAVSADAPAADAERKIKSTKASAAPRQAGPRPKGAPSVMVLLPDSWKEAMSDDERERVMTAIEDEMATGRTVADMKARIHRRLPTWRHEDVRRPVAAALTVIRRGYDCPHLACEDHVLPSGYPCEACAAIGAKVNQARLAAVVDEGQAPAEPPAPVAPPAPVDQAPTRFQRLERVESAGDEVRDLSALRAELAAVQERQRLRAAGRTLTA